MRTTRHAANAVALVVAFLTAFPIYWMALSAVKPAGEIQSLDVRPWTLHPTLEHFARVLTGEGFARYFGWDVTLLRIVAVVLLLASGGTMILVYLVLMLLLPYAPLERGGARVGKIPAKIREFAEFLRSKVSATTT